MTGIGSHIWGLSRAQDRVWAQVSGLRPSKAGIRLFMNLQAYIDDSYDKDGVFVLGGCISTAQNWAEFSREWESALPKFGVLGDDLKYRFKMSQMAILPERMARVPIFYSIIEKHVLGFVAAKIDILALRRARARISVPGAAIEWGEYADPFYITFRCLMDKFHISRELMTDAFPLDQKIDFYFDQQSQKGVIYRVWENYLKNRSEDVAKFYGVAPKFEDDDEFLPLQAADFWAWWARKWHKEGTPEKVMRPEFDAFQKPKNQKKKFLRISIVLTEDDLVKNLIQSVRLIIGEGRPILDRGVSV